jgi:hypothetical protein
MRGHDDQYSEEDSLEGYRYGVEIVNFLCYSCIRMSMVFIILMHTYLGTYHQHSIENHMSARVYAFKSAFYPCQLFI